MSIISDMLTALDRETRARNAKKSLGFAKPSPVFVVGAKHAFLADLQRLTGATGDNLMAQGRTLHGVPVEFAPVNGWRIDWRAA